jgi:hypothetical protein
MAIANPPNRHASQTASNGDGDPMKMFSIKQTCAVIRLADVSGSPPPLLEQARPLLIASPFIILDVDGVHFSSMLLGEVVNLYQAFTGHWKEKRHGMAMVRVPAVSQQVLKVAKLLDRIPVYDTLDEAVKSFNLSALKAGAGA